MVGYPPDDVFMNLKSLWKL